MRIAHLFRIFVALLHLFIHVFPTNGRHTNSTIVHQHHPLRHHSKANKHFNNNTVSDFGRWLAPPEAQQLLRTSNSGKLDCCPSHVEMTEPGGGRNRDGILVELYRSGEIKQSFYERSCLADVEGKPCRFMDKKLHNQSRCEQQFGWTYALVKQIPGQHTNHLSTQSGGYFPTIPATGPGDDRWMMDYIKVRSGCSCVVYPKTKAQKKTPKRPRRSEDSDV